jgi:hypothetical protein
MPCPAGSYCPGGISYIQCPEKSSSTAGSATVCMCLPVVTFVCVYMEIISSFMVTSSLESAIIILIQVYEHDSEPGASQLAQCQCQSGYYGTDPTKCLLCPENNFCKVHTSQRFVYLGSSVSWCEQVFQPCVSMLEVTGETRVCGMHCGRHFSIVTIQHDAKCIWSHTSADTQRITNGCAP